MIRPLLIALLAIAAPTPLVAQGAPAPAPDYANPDTWLCRPGRADSCTADQSATVIKADGSRSIEAFAADPSAKFDCFYVYPTVSIEPTPNASGRLTGAEKQVAAFQAARFTKHCRVFAPLYRQVTLTALRDLLAGKPVNADRTIAYDDVKRAWQHYLAADNHGRGVVLIGHSQGSGILKQLIAEEIDGKPAQKLLISAMLMGTNVAVPAGKDVGGDFKAVPLCRKADQTGCLVSYVTFRRDAPPPETSRFGVVAQPGMVAACVNPAALGGGKALTDNYLGTHGAGLASSAQAPWTKDGAPVTTPFVKAPGLISAECVKQGRFSYLAVTVNADPADPRTDTIGGDVEVNGVILKEWGLHLIDMPVEMGNLVELSNSEAKAWLRANGR
ncbi:DUF3089 domain-containing protein [Sphingomonas sp. GlSt437]|uniref:DUF3089 domain-containing protein n=1 Tax=Sphingomonas sp. GlSt437 TaxID=3389970 RepID=UPI003A84C5F0